MVNQEEIIEGWPEIAKLFQAYSFLLLAAAVVYKFDPEYAKFLLIPTGKIMFLVSAIGVIYFGPHHLQKIVTKENFAPSKMGKVMERHLMSDQVSC